VAEREVYRLFGAVVALHDGPRLRANPAPPGTPVDVDVRIIREAPEVSWDDAELRYSTEPADGRTEPDFHFYRLPDRDVIRIGRSTDVHVLDREILYHLKDPTRAYLVEIVLLGLGMAFWLERSGTAVLHGSTVALDGRAVAFVAAGGTGKSSLATHLTVAGDTLVTEDLLRLSWRDGVPFAEPGVAQVRLWPEVAAQFVEDWQELEQPHPGFSKRKLLVGDDGLGAFAAEPLPLDRIYVLQRTTRPDHPPTVLPLSAGDGLAELLTHSYLPEIGERFGWQPARLPQLARILSASPVSILRYRGGADQVPAIRAAITSDLAER
jgi:hypothetical protein